MLTEQQVVDAIKHNVSGIRSKQIAMDEDLSSAGMDSLDFFSLLLELEEIAGIKVLDEDVDKLKTIKSMLDYFNCKS